MHQKYMHRGFLGRRGRYIWLCSLMIVLALVISACGGGSEEPAAAEPEAAATEPAEEPAEAEAEPTEEAAEAEEEAEPTEAPAEEAEATEEPAEAEAEATEEPAEEAETEATAEPAEAEEEATAQPEEAMMEVSGDAEAGQYVATLTGGCGCHFNRDLGALAGGFDFEGDYGVAYAYNITPDVETGIGSWSEDDVVTVLHTGVHPDGYQLVGAMPYRAFSALSDQEALDVAAYLFSLEPVTNQVPEREIVEEPEPFVPAEEPPAEPPADPVARGEQIVTFADCGRCHTSSNEDGTPNMDLMLAGGPIGGGEIASNITPDEATGIGSWSEEEIATYLTTGVRPDGTEAQDSMAEQIERRFNILTEEDALAIAAYLKSIPAVEYDPYAEAE